MMFLGKGEMFGYEDFLRVNPSSPTKKNDNNSRSSCNYSYGVQCTESGEVIMIRGVHFRKFILSDIQTVGFLKQQIEQHTAFMDNREKEVMLTMEGFE